VEVCKFLQKKSSLASQCIAGTLSSHVYCGVKVRMEVQNAIIRQITAIVNCCCIEMLTGYTVFFVVVRQILQGKERD